MSGDGKKLLIVSQYFFPEMGAPQNRLLEMANAFVGRGWDVRVLTAMPNYPKGRIFEDYRGKWTSVEQSNKIGIWRSWIYASNSKSTIPRIISMISFGLSMFTFLRRARKFQPDVCFVESPPLLVGYFGYHFSGWIRSKFWFNVSDLWPLTAKELGAISDGWFYQRLESLERLIYRKAVLVTGQSEEIVKHIQKNQVRTYLFRNGVDPSRFKNRKQHSGSMDQKIRIVYAGLFGVAQGIAAIIENVDFSKLGMEFHIYGGGAEMERIESLIKDAEGVFFHGTVTREEIPEILNEYDVYLVPLVKNIHGAVPSKVYEAMAAGLPIIFFGSGEGATIVRDNDLGWVVEPGKFQELTECLRSVRDSPDLNRFAQNGIQNSREKFNRETILKNLVNEINKIAS